MIPVADGSIGKPGIQNDLRTKSYTTVLSEISPCVSNNPCFLEEDPSVSFKPTLLVGLYPVQSSNVNDRDTMTVSFNVETEVSCSFRGLRKSKVV